MTGICTGKSNVCKGPKGEDGIRQCPVWVYKRLPEGYFGPMGGTLPNYEPHPEWVTHYMYASGITACGIGPDRSYGGWAGPTPNSACARIHASPQPRLDVISRRCQNCDDANPPWSRRMTP